MVPNAPGSRPRLAALIIFCCVSLLFVEVHLLSPKQLPVQHTVTRIDTSGILCEPPQDSVRKVAIIGWFSLDADGILTPLTRDSVRCWLRRFLHSLLYQQIQKPLQHRKRHRLRKIQLCRWSLDYCRCIRGSRRTS